MTLPPVAGRWAIGAALAVWIGVVAPWWLSMLVAAVCVATLVRLPVDPRGLAVLGALMLLGAASSTVAGIRAASDLAVTLPSGSGTAAAVVNEDTQARSGLAVGTVVQWEGRPWQGPRVALDTDESLTAGDIVVVRGRFDRRSVRIGDERLVNVLIVDRLIESHASENPLVATGNRIRARVRSTFDLSQPPGALMAGFLVGDTDGLPVHAMEDLRRAGLAHYVAVSGSNVAVFLGALWIAAAPLAVRPTARALLGLVGLAVFVVATRWEPSVVRASVMAAIALVGGPLGLTVDAWTALGVAATLVLLVSPHLAMSLGFQLSVLATIGVMVGVGLVGHRRPRWMWMSLGATVGAQVLVAPLIVGTFGTMPLAAPIANLLAGPLVAFATAIGIAAVAIPLEPVTRFGEAICGVVLGIAEFVSGGPQLSAVAVVGVLALGLAVAWRPVRPVGLAALVVVLLAMSGVGTPWPDGARAVVLDVGQGDAILVQDPEGAAMLVDGGRDPLQLDRLLRHFGVGRLDFVVATHGDHDHVGGLHGLMGAMPIGTLVVSHHAERDDGIRALVDDARRNGVPITRVRTGSRFDVGVIDVDVLGPERRYATTNDGSIVLMLGQRTTLLLPGDIGDVSQRELPDLAPDALVVPHHGASTTDRRWLEQTVRPGAIAVLSYGPNTYGHPHPDIVGLLDTVGADVRRTEDGHVVIPLG